MRGTCLPYGFTDGPSCEYNNNFGWNAFYASDEDRLARHSATIADVLGREHSGQAGGTGMEPRLPPRKEQRVGILKSRNGGEVPIWLCRACAVRARVSRVSRGLHSLCVTLG